jgi:hypothetical protein
MLPLAVVWKVNVIGFVYDSKEYADESHPPSVVFIAEFVVVIAFILSNVNESQVRGIVGVGVLVGVSEGVTPNVSVGVGVGVSLDVTVGVGVIDGIKSIKIGSPPIKLDDIGESCCNTEGEVN